MSAERVAAFSAAAAAQPSGPALTREIENLRRFMQRHQSEALSSTSLFTAILSHVRNPAALACGRTGESLAMGLLEDALKMPERVIATAQKRRLLALLEAEVARVAATENAAGTSAAETVREGESMKYLVVDMSHDGMLSLLDEGGEVRDDIRAEEAMLPLLRGALTAGKDVFVAVDENGRAHICGVE